METLQAAISLEQVLDLVFGVFLGQTTDEELAWSIIDLSRDDTHGYSVECWNWSTWLDFWVLIKFRRAPNSQVDVLVSDSVELDRS